MPRNEKNAQTSSSRKTTIHGRHAIYSDFDVVLFLSFQTSLSNHNHNAKKNIAFFSMP
jgi:hypothetical protein